MEEFERELAAEYGIEEEEFSGDVLTEVKGTHSRKR